MRKTALITAIIILAAAIMPLYGCGILKARKPYHTDSELEECYGYLSLTGDERDFYRKVDANMYLSETLPFIAPHSIDIARMSEIIDIFIADHPEVCWINEEMNVSSIGHIGDTELVSLNFSLEGEEREEAIKAQELVVEGFASSVPEGASEYEKELLINDFLIENCSYDFEAAEQEEVQNVYAIGNEHYAYGALVDHKAVCDGYSRAFKLLCDRVGLTSLVISGNADGYAHAWNAVMIEGDWYYVDVTWNDNDEDEELSIERLLYLNMTEKTISVDHEIAPLYSDRGDFEAIFYNVYIPECTCEEYNYVKRTFPCYGKGTTLRTLGIELADAAKERKDYFGFWVEDSIDFEALFNDLIEGSAWELAMQANGINGREPIISSNSYLYRCDSLRTIIMELKYV